MTRWLWTAPSGLVTDLSDWAAGTYVVAGGTAGQLAPSYNFTTQQLAGVDGVQVQQISVDPGTPQLGIDLVAEDGEELRQRLRALAHTLRPRRGIGRLTAVADDGSARHVPCYYRKGLESGTYRVTRYRTVIEFYAPHPWWRGQPLTYGWSLAAASAFFPIFPMNLSASTISGEVPFDLSDTDSPTFPTWLVTGPGTQLTLSNTYDAPQPDGTLAPVTRSLVLNATIGDGQVVRIVTRPGHQSINLVTLDADGAVTSVGASLFGSLASDPAMFPLVDDVNTVTALLTGAGPASRIHVAADRLYSGAL